MNEHLKELDAKRKMITQNVPPAAGRFSARERINRILDRNTFVETGAFIKPRPEIYGEKELPSDGLVCGYGAVGGRLAFIYSQDPSVLGGAFGEAHGRKISELYKRALQTGAPVIGILDSAGVRLLEGLDAFAAMGGIYSVMAKASGVVPQITLIMGGAMGSAAVIPSLSDFVFASENARLFFESPAAGIPSCGEKVKTRVFAGEEEMFPAVRELLGYLPENNLDAPPALGMTDPINRMVTALNRDAYPMEDVISMVCDSEQYFELSLETGAAVTTGFGRLGGSAAGIIGTKKELLDAASLEKAAGFVSFCDAFSIPVVTLVNAAGYDDPDQDRLICASAKLIQSLTSATVPKVSVITGKAVGSPYLIFNSKHIGADAVFCWAGAEVGLMEADAAVNVMLSQELKNEEDVESFRARKLDEYRRDALNPYKAAELSYVDDIIEPAETRKILISALEMLYGKRAGLPGRKHPSRGF